MYSSFKTFDTKTKLTCLIALTVGFQQFPILRIGGSFKIYELFAICLLFINVFSPVQNRWIFTKTSFAALCLFVISPLISYFYSVILLPYPSGFYRRYADTESLKLNYWIFPALQLIFMFLNYCVFDFLTNAKKIYTSFETFVKACVGIGTAIALYSLFAMFFVDIIALLPSFLQNKQPYAFRSSGLSQEPSFYVLYQTWIVLFVYYSKKVFTRKVWVVVFCINLLSLLLTFSTTLAALPIIFILSFFILKNPLKVKIWLLTTILCFALAGYLYILSTTSGALMQELFITKLTNFFTAPQHTLDSGSFRSYTTRIGIEIFKEHPLLGVGVGNSIYYMYLFADKMGIAIFGEVLFAGSFPQNTFSMVLSEQGILGGIFLFLFLFLILSRFWKYRNYDNYCRMFFIGFLFNLSVLMTIAPIYSIFLWVFPALGLGYIKYKLSISEKLTINEQ